MFRTLTTSLGMMLLASSFAVAGQRPASAPNAAKSSAQATAVKSQSSVHRKQMQTNGRRTSRKHPTRHRATNATRTKTHAR